MIKRAVITALVLAACTSPSFAGDQSRKDAVTAAAFLINLAYQCQGKLGDNARADARADSVLTMQAGGYPPAETEGLLTKMIASLETTPPVGTMPAAMCRAFYEKIMDGGPAFRDKLKTEG